MSAEKEVRNISEVSMTQPINGKFEMPSLPYAASDLAPVLSAETIESHYGKHLQFLAILNYVF